MLKIKPGKERRVAALAYADMGWPIVLVYGITNDGRCSCGYSSCKSPGKHPRIKDWTNQASCDKATIRKWFDQWPDSNVGILTGAASGLVVLDVDGPEGEESLKDLPIPATVAVKTRRGRHLYFRHPGYLVRNFVGRRPGLDLRADGGFVVAPPSKHAEGEYQWVM